MFAGLFYVNIMLVMIVVTPLLIDLVSKNILLWFHLHNLFAGLCYKHSFLRY